MDWFRSYPYASVLTAAGLLLIVGGFVVVRKTATTVTPSSHPVAWGGAGAVLSPSVSGDAVTAAQQPSILEQTQHGAPYTYILPTPQQTDPSSGTPSDTFDFDAFITLLSDSSATGGTAHTTTSVSATDAYAFIPTGLVSTVSPPKRTKLQQSVYDYGNEIGSLIQSFELEHPNASRVVMDQAQDRADAGKAASVQALGKALSALGDNLLTVDDVPSSFEATHEALAKSYRELGQKLVLVPQAPGDDAFISAVQSYNTSADAFIKNYVALANLFVSYGVVFSPGDAGSVFTFTQTAL